MKKLGEYQTSAKYKIKKWKEVHGDEPMPPIGRVIIDDVINQSGFCPKCYSTAVRKPWIFGKRYCTNKECEHFDKPIL